MVPAPDDVTQRLVVSADNHKVTGNAVKQFREASLANWMPTYTIKFLHYDMVSNQL